MQITLEYPVNPRPRYGYGKPPHPLLYQLIDSKREIYKWYLEYFSRYKEHLSKIDLKAENAGGSAMPFWKNDWFTGLDAFSLYSFLCLTKPIRYFEIGSGMSTRFARRAISDHRLNTKIISIDPHPRNKIDSICDSIVRKPVEEIDIELFRELRDGDILFVDNSHRVFMNSDAAVVFLDILPVLARGVIIHFHDIFLPYDYPPEWGKRFYSEQYLLAAFLLAQGRKFDILLANAFVSRDPELKAAASLLWEGPVMNKVEMTGGASFWIKIN